MKRHFYLADKLSDLTQVQRELERNGVSSPQIHVLSWDDAEVEQSELHQVEAVLKKDVVRSMEKGAIVGAIGAALVLLIAYLTGVSDTAAGWVPFIFLAIVVLVSAPGRAASSAFSSPTTSSSASCEN